LSDNWYNLYGFRIGPHNIICDGCVSCENPRLPDKKCPVRACVIEKDLENCAFCVDFICEKLKTRIVERKEIENKLNRKLTNNEYEFFVKPYESKVRLEKIRVTI
jgi:hypothetical protein